MLAHFCATLPKGEKTQQVLNIFNIKSGFKTLLKVELKAYSAELKT